ncbi:hypothetical protein [Enterococcus sp. JM9B]|uniref:hypothetical protein n=1 Tax=Enterococcus sp. JM9B TaxID=1857216 RepID=UPI0013750D23|nr:hypothetical protein [Enterococcus sp. JM9B]KAF1303521.1 hypothetical protein BAU16_04030 [Enterococcus sp. JM9B]
MKSSKISLAKNLLYSVSANFITMFISVVAILFFPKILGVEGYGYYQLYLFYISFAGLFHFGLVDGIALKYAGIEYKDLHGERLGIQFWFLFIIEIIILILVSIWIGIFDESITDKTLIIIYSVISILLTNMRSLILSILQSANRILEYSRLTRVDRILFIFPAMLYLVFTGNNFSVLLIIDLVCRGIALVVGMGMTFDILFRNYIPNLKDVIATKKLVFSGINLTLSFIASQLIIGVIRFGVERKWSIVEFGKISLTLSLSNMFITFINAIGATLFPYLRRIENRNLSMIYSNIRISLMTISFGLLLLYYPFSFVLIRWLPAYEESIHYMGILFPIFIYESKTSLLTNTFLKTIRGEKRIFVANILTLFLSLILTGISIFILESLTYAVFSILVLLVFRSDLSEYFLEQKIKITNKNRRIFEFTITMVFVLLNIFDGRIFSFFVYLIFYGIFLFINSKEIRSIIILMKRRGQV